MEHEIRYFRYGRISILPYAYKFFTKGTSFVLKTKERQGTVLPTPLLDSHVPPYLYPFIFHAFLKFSLRFLLNTRYTIPYIKIKSIISLVLTDNHITQHSTYLVTRLSCVMPTTSQWVPSTILGYRRITKRGESSVNSWYYATRCRGRWVTKLMTNGLRVFVS